MSESVIYHIDTNFLLNYLIPDNKDFHQAVRNKLERRNWSNDAYRISKYALGETFNRVLNFNYTGTITFESVFKKMEYVRELMNSKRIETFGLDEVDDEWIRHFKQLQSFKDYSVENADLLILAFFCADKDAKRIYTADYNIIKSNINDYLNGLGKRIEEIS